MILLGNGATPSGELYLPPLDPHVLAEALRERYRDESLLLNAITNNIQANATFRVERERKPTVDPGDPLSAGWTYCLAASQHNRHEIKEVIRPLAKHRGMRDPDSPLLYDGTDPQSWIERQYTSLPDEERPLFVLLVGGPDALPFALQSHLDVAASVGRIDLDSPDDIKAYVDKLIRSDGGGHLTDPRALFAATDQGSGDPTSLSRAFMIPPLVNAATNLGLQVDQVLGNDCTKTGLLDALATSAASLVYTASHGLGASELPLEEQLQINGSICCQIEPGQGYTDGALVAAHDVPSAPFLEGSIFFQFACFGYGTPAVSSLARWHVPVPAQNSSRDFVAALPKRLLAHPRGPLAFVGHLDIALLAGFHDESGPAKPTQGHWDIRMAPFIAAVRDLLLGQPVGYSMRTLNLTLGLLNQDLVETWDAHAGGATQADIEDHIAGTFLRRNDAENYMVLGDPAARLHIADQPDT